MDKFKPNSTPLKLKINELVQSIFTPKPYLTIPEWAEQYRQLPSNSPRPGAWDNSLNPWLIEPSLALSPHSPTQQVTLMLASQVGKTELLLNMIGYYLTQRPSSILFVTPNENLSISMAKERVWPMLERLPMDSIKLEHGTSSTTHIESTYSILDIVSAASPTELSSRPRQIILFDEVERAVDIPGEGDVVKLAIQRSQNFLNRKICLVSSPTVEGGKIHSYYMNGTQEEYKVKCLDCHHDFTLDFSTVRMTDKTDPSTAAIECPSCGHRHTEKHRMDLVRTGYWFSQRYQKPSSELTMEEQVHRSFKASVLVSPFVSLRQLMKEFLEVKNNPPQLQTFLNLKLAQPWVPQKTELPKYESLMRLKTPLDQSKFDVLTLGCDVQGSRIEALLLGFSSELKQYAILDYFRLSSLEELEAIFKTYPISLATIDSGFSTHTVYDFVKHYPPSIVRAIKGSEGRANSLPFTQSHELPNPIRFRHHLWVTNTYYFKSIAIDLIKNGQLLFNHSDGLDEDFFKGLLSEELKIINGKQKWVKLYGRNEPFDTLNYAILAMHILQHKPHTLTTQAFNKELPKPSVTQQPNQQKPKPQQPQQSFNLWKNPGLKR